MDTNARFEGESVTMGAFSDQSRLMRLPAELRSMIFTIVLRDVRCRKPIVVWDDVCIGIPRGEPPLDTAILLACRTAYEDCNSILFGRRAVDMSVRYDRDDQKFPRFQLSLGAIEECSWLRHLRHIELEVVYETSDPGALSRVTGRLRKLGNAFRRVGKLKTIQLEFFNESPTNGVFDSSATNTLLETSAQLFCEKFVGMSRNISAARSMGSAQWEALRCLLDEHAKEEKEAFREINYGYWEHAQATDDANSDVANDDASEADREGREDVETE